MAHLYAILDKDVDNVGLISPFIVEDARLDGTCDIQLRQQSIQPTFDMPGADVSL
jgi:hypothetical protein